MRACALKTGPHEERNPPSSSSFGTRAALATTIGMEYLYNNYGHTPTSHILYSSATTKKCVSNNRVYLKKKMKENNY